MRLINSLLAVVLLTLATALSTANNSEQAQVSQTGSPFRRNSEKTLRVLKAHQEDAANEAEERINVSGLLKKFQKALPGTSAYKSAAAAKKAEAALRKANEDKLFQRMVNGEADNELFRWFGRWNAKGWSKATVSEFLQKSGRSEDVAEKIATRYFDWGRIPISNVAKPGK